MILQGEELEKALDKLEKEIEKEENYLLQSGWVRKDDAWYDEKSNSTAKDSSQAFDWQKGAELKAKGWRQTELKRIPYLCKDENDSRIDTIAIFQHPETFKVYYFWGAVSCMDGNDNEDYELLTLYANGKLLPESITKVPLKDPINGRLYFTIVGDPKNLREYYGD